MIPRELLATATVPGQEAELRLFRHDRDFILSVGRNELMTSRSHGSEDMLAELVLAGADRRKGLRVLLGGLGMGFTLARALELVGPDAAVEVVELVPEVVEWNRSWFRDLNRGACGDPRTTAVVGDVAETIRASEGAWDAILLDVDNGPEALTAASNETLYATDGLAAARRALRPGGVLAVWSSTRFDWFTRRLRAVGFEVSERAVRSRRTKGPRHTIWLATRPGPGRAGRRA